MARTALLDPRLDRDPAPVVGRLASKLLHSAMGGKRRDDDDQWTLITQMLNFASEAEQQIVSQKRRISQLEALSQTDELTGLANRRAFDNFMKATLAAARRYRESGVLVFIDLDNFKNINDTLGHESGDMVLRKIGDYLSQEIRESDHVARLGGDEFVVVLTRCNSDQGNLRAAMIKKGINKLEVSCEDCVVHVRASVGTDLFGPKSSFKNVLKRADRAMYRNKQERQVALTAISNETA